MRTRSEAAAAKTATTRDIEFFTCACGLKQSRGSAVKDADGDLTCMSCGRPLDPTPTDVHKIDERPAPQPAPAANEQAAPPAKLPTRAEAKAAKQAAAAAATTAQQDKLHGAEPDGWELRPGAKPATETRVAAEPEPPPAKPVQGRAEPPPPENLSTLCQQLDEDGYDVSLRELATWPVEVRRNLAEVYADTTLRKTMSPEASKLVAAKRRPRKPQPTPATITNVANAAADPAADLVSSTWAEEMFRVAEFSNVKVGPFYANTRLEPGETRQDALARLDADLVAHAERERKRKVDSYLEMLGYVAKAVAGAGE